MSFKSEEMSEVIEGLGYTIGRLHLIGLDREAEQLAKLQAEWDQKLNNGGYDL